MSSMATILKRKGNRQASGLGDGDADGDNEDDEDDKSPCAEPLLMSYSGLNSVWFSSSRVMTNF